MVMKAAETLSNNYQSQWQRRKYKLHLTSIKSVVECPQMEEKGKRQRKSLRLRIGEFLHFSDGRKTELFIKDAHPKEYVKNNDLILFYPTERWIEEYRKRFREENAQKLEEYKSFLLRYHAISERFGYNFANTHMEEWPERIEEYPDDYDWIQRASTFGLVRDKNGRLVAKKRNKPESEWWSIV